MYCKIPGQIIVEILTFAIKTYGNFTFPQVDFRFDLNYVLFSYNIIILYLLIIVQKNPVIIITNKIINVTVKLNN